MDSLKTAYFRFYEELNDFLPEGKKKVKFAHQFGLRQSVKDMIESLGVPHAEIDLILVNGTSVDFSYIAQDKDDISVYPVFESFDISAVQHLRHNPLREPRYIADVHLGSLARYMRMAGLDTFYSSSILVDDIIKISLNEKRAILTKSRELLKRNEVTHGYFVRNNSAEDQLKEVITRFQLWNEVKPFSRCIECNVLLGIINNNEAAERVPEKVKKYHSEFYTCSSCGRIYWKGSHYQRMQKLLNRLGFLLKKNDI